MYPLYNFSEFPFLNWKRLASFEHFIFQNIYLYTERYFRSPAKILSDTGWFDGLTDNFIDLVNDEIVH